MRKRWSALLAWGMLAAPASAYPTSLLSVPTADILSYKDLHFGIYTYTPWAPDTGSYSLSANLGLFEGFSLGDWKIGATELGIDAAYPRESMGSSVAGSIKVGLLSESDWLPGLAAGTFYRGLPDQTETANFTYLSATKTLAPGGFDLGAYTLGGYTESAASGFFLGGTKSLTDWCSLTADYTSGDSGMGGMNVGMSVTVAENVSLTGGYFRATAPDASQLFVLLDIDVPFAGNKEE